MKILIAIPCYNCEKQVSRVLQELHEVLPKVDYQVLVIDNRSHDNTIEVAVNNMENYQIKGQVIKNNNNIGLGGSHKVALSYGQNNNFTHIAILHGDNQAVSSELSLLINSFEKEKLDYSLGSRFMIQSKRINYPLVRTLGNFVLNSLYSLFTLKLIKDLGSGLNIYRTSFVKKIDLEKCSNSFNFNMDFLLQSIDHGVKLRYLPITWREEDKISNVKLISIGVETLKSLVKWRFKRESLYSCSLEYDIIYDNLNNI